MNSNMWGVITAVLACLLIFLPFIALALLSNKIVRLTVERFPAQAKALLPQAFWGGRHPELFLFMFRGRWIDLLRTDAKLWRTRQRVVAILVYFLSILLLLITALLVVAWHVATHAK